MKTGSAEKILPPPSASLNQVRLLVGAKFRSGFIEVRHWTHEGRTLPAGIRLLPRYKKATCQNEVTPKKSDILNIESAS